MTIIVQHIAPDGRKQRREFKYTGAARQFIIERVSTDADLQDGGVAIGPKGDKITVVGCTLRLIFGRDVAPPAPPALDTYTAVGRAEGFIEATEEEQIEAWQHLHDSGLAYQLQGWFGRTAQQLIANGTISA